MAVTISDVAKEAGVSTSTVSKVLNNWSSISPATCERVHEAIKKLHYTPNARAVSFAKGASHNILFLSSLKKEEAYRNPHMFDILCGVRRTLAEHGYTLMLTDFPDTAEPQEYLTGLIGKGLADGPSRSSPGCLRKAGFPISISAIPAPEAVCAGSTQTTAWQGSLPRSICWNAAMKKSHSSVNGARIIYPPSG